MRLKSIKNIEKITKTMKIVASTRLNKAQRAMASSRVFNKSDSEFYENVEPEKAEDSKTLLVVVSSDKGLCGSIHSQISKSARRRFDELNGNVDIVTIGDKVKAQLSRTHSEQLKLAFNGVGKEAPNFNEVALIVDEIKKLGTYENIEVLYNKFVSGVAFEPSKFSVFAAEAIEKAPGFSKYEVEEGVESDALADTLSEFSLANSILSAQAEGYASEISARRNAMDNASKNAGDMINSYSILYNRTRQAVITNELVDIITGASSLD